MSTTYVFTTQEDTMFDVDYCECPRCHAPHVTSRRVVPSGMFRCVLCDLLYDEPSVRDPEVAFVGVWEDIQDLVGVEPYTHDLGAARQGEVSA